MTEVVFVRLINQVQDSIRRGEIAKRRSQRQVHPYIDINNVNETAAFTKLMLQLTVDRVLPKVKADLEALLAHNIKKALSHSQDVQGLQQLPGVDSLQSQLSQRLAKEITATLYNSINGVLKYPYPLS